MNKPIPNLYGESECLNMTAGPRSYEGMRARQTRSHRLARLGSRYMYLSVRSFTTNAVPKEPVLQL